MYLMPTVIVNMALAVSSHVIGDLGLLSSQLFKIHMQNGCVYVHVA